MTTNSLSTRPTTPFRPAPAHNGHEPGRPAAPENRAPAAPGWANAGWAAGALSIAVYGIVSSGLYVPTEALADNVNLVAELDGAHAWIWAHQIGTFLLAVLVAIFGLGLRRRLAATAPAGSLVPDAAAAGMLLVSAMCLVGGGISTEMFASVRHLDEIDPDTVAAQLMVFNTFGWVWAGGILTTGATAIAGLRQRSVSRGLGIFAAVMTGITLVSQLVPLQYLAVAPIMLFLIVTGIAMQREVTPRTVTEA